MGTLAPRRRRFWNTPCLLNFAVLNAKTSYASATSTQADKPAVPSVKPYSKSPCSRKPTRIRCQVSPPSQAWTTISRAPKKHRNHCSPSRPLKHPAQRNHSPRWGNPPTHSKTVGRRNLTHSQTHRSSNTIPSRIHPPPTPTVALRVRQARETEATPPQMPRAVSWDLPSP